MTSFCGGEYKARTDYERLRACGRDTRIYRRARLAGAERMAIGRGCRIDDFAFLFAGRGLRMGDRVHVASFTSVAGGGTVTIGDYAGLAAGTRLVTGTDKHLGEGLPGPCMPDEFRAVERARIEIGKHVVLFTNAVVLPGVTIGEGCIVGAGSVVTHDLEPWGVYRWKPGGLARVQDRPRARILEMEAQCVQKYGY